MVRTAERYGDKRAVALLVGYALTGARASELLQLKISDIGLDYISVKGKGSKYRDLFIPPAVWDAIRDYVNTVKRRSQNVSDEQHIFLNEKNTDPMDRQGVFRIVKKYGGLARVKLSRAKPHNLRHLYGMRLFQEMIEETGQVDLNTAADLLGHAEVNTTRIYTRPTRAQLLKRVNGMR
jgi:integrase/recombinase XerD